MHFAADPLELIKILGFVTASNVDEHIDIALTASGCRLVAKNGSLQAGTTAMIFDAGQCKVSNSRAREILSALKELYGRKKHPDNIIVEITDSHLKFGPIVVNIPSSKPDEKSTETNLRGEQLPMLLSSKQNSVNSVNSPSQSTRTKFKDLLQLMRRVLPPGLYFVTVGIFILGIIYFPSGSVDREMCIYSLLVALMAGLVYRASRSH